MKKLIVALVCSLAVQPAFAGSSTLHLTSENSDCPDRLDMTETFEGGSLTQLKFTRDNSHDQYIPDEYFCSNLSGVQTDENGNSLTCILETSPIDQGYDVKIVYHQASRDPSDYGLTFAYEIQRTPDGIQANWGKRRWYDGKPIICDYI